jgi:hypothetical protein
LKVIDPTKFLPDRDVLTVASQMMSNMLAVEFHGNANEPKAERLAAMANIAYLAAFALLREHNRLFKEAQLHDKRRK